MEYIKAQQQLRLTLIGAEIGNSNNIEEIEKLEGCIIVRRGSFEVKEVEGLGPLIHIIIDYKEAIPFLVALARWIHTKIKKAKNNPRIEHKNTYISIGTVNIIINKEDTEEDILKKLKEIAELPETK